MFEVITLSDLVNVLIKKDVMILTFHFIILKRVSKYGIFRNNKNTDKLSQNKFNNFSKQYCLF